MIDPTLGFSTFLGGSGTDAGTGIAVDAAGDAYVTGSTTSANFPSANGLLSGAGGNADAFVAKYAAGTSASLAYGTYLGGSDNDYGTGIAVDASGHVYVTGYTASANFPNLLALQQNLGGGPYDAFLTKLTDNPVPGAPTPAVTLQMYNPVPATEGAPTGDRKLGTFTFSNAQLGDFTATIHWGDPSLPDTTGTIQWNGTTWGADVIGSQTYPTPGGYEIQVTITDTRTGQTWMQQAGILVLDAPLSGTPVTIASTFPPDPDIVNPQPIPLQESMALGTFNPDPSARFLVAKLNSASGIDPYATIDWGDGHSSIGNVGTCYDPTTNSSAYGVCATPEETVPIQDSYHNNHNFFIFNIYAHAGTYPVAVQVQDRGGSRLTIRSTAQVAVLAPTATPPSVDNMGHAITLYPEFYNRLYSE